MRELHIRQANTFHGEEVTVRRRKRTLDEYDDASYSVDSTKKVMARVERLSETDTAELPWSDLGEAPQDAKYVRLPVVDIDVDKDAVMIDDEVHEIWKDHTLKGEQASTTGIELVVQPQR